MSDEKMPYETAGMAIVQVLNNADERSRIGAKLCADDALREIDRLMCIAPQPEGDDPRENDEFRERLTHLRSLVEMLRGHHERVWDR